MATLHLLYNRCLIEIKETSISMSGERLQCQILLQLPAQRAIWWLKHAQTWAGSNYQTAESQKHTAVITRIWVCPETQKWNSVPPSIAREKS